MVGIMTIGENVGEHVRAGAGEFERVRSQRAGEFEITRQIERAFCDLTGHDPRGLASVCETLIFAKLFDIAQREAGVDAIHTADEIVDHAVGFGMAGVESVQFAIGDHINTRQLLRLEHDHDGVTQRDA